MGPKAPSSISMSGAVMEDLLARILVALSENMGTSHPTSPLPACVTLASSLALTFWVPERELGGRRGL